jgi:glutaredoxin-related protein
MSCILYYSNYCEHCKKLLQTLSKSNTQKDIHFICIDKRVKDSNNKTFIVLENGQKIIMPENVTRVPALLLLNQGYQVLYGESILQHLKPRQEVEVRKATQNNMEPMAFSFGGGSFGDVVSDQFSFLDQAPEDLKADGNGGMRQMHNYVDLNYTDKMTIQTPNDEQEYKGANRIAEDGSKDLMAKIQAQREAELNNITKNRPPMSI